MRPLLLINILSVAVIAGFALWAFRLPVPEARPIPAALQHQAPRSVTGGVAIAVPNPGPAMAAAPSGKADTAFDLQAETQDTASGSVTDSMLDADWVAQTAQLTGIPPRALQAYAAAATVVNAGDAACGLGWNTVAAIGYIESGHGTYGGGVVLPDAGSSRPIIGPALNGKGYAAIPDTDGGRLDGDVQWDRAVGPMQFIPSTWLTAGRDGTGDGTADPHNLDDAALSAAAYLCADGRNLAEPGDWTAAVLSYNRSGAYVNNVRDQANSYASLSGTTAGR